jgi:pyruvate dehydrogenase E2 component (dihydrolipoamide acetyltransferase)
MPINVLMPALSPTMTEGTLAKWLKKEGDMVKSGDVIAEIETDKATMEVESADEGKIGRILVQAGTSGIAVNTPIAVLLEDGEDASAIASPAAANVNQNPSPQPSPEGRGGGGESLSPREKEAAQPQGEGQRVFATPLARRIAVDKNIDLKSVQGSGPHGRIVKADVENVKPGAAAAPAPQAAKSPAPAASSGPNAKQLADMLGMEYTEIPNNNIKKVTARRLLEAKQTIPHFYLTVDCVLDNLLKARAEINAVADGAYKLSVNDFIIKANAMALKPILQQILRGPTKPCCNTSMRIFRLRWQRRTV